MEQYEISSLEVDLNEYEEDQEDEDDSGSQWESFLENLS